MTNQPIPIQPVALSRLDQNPKCEVKIDLDERSFLFPAGKSISQLALSSDGSTILADALYPF